MFKQARSISAVVSVELIDSFGDLRFAKITLLYPAIILICNLLKLDLHWLPRYQFCIFYMVFLIYCTVEPRFNEPLYNEVLGTTNDFSGPRKSKIYRKEPQYNETYLKLTYFATHCIGYTYEILILACFQLKW